MAKAVFTVDPDSASGAIQKETHISPDDAPVDDALASDDD